MWRFDFWEDRFFTAAFDIGQHFSMHTWFPHMSFDPHTRSHRKTFRNDDVDDERGCVVDVEVVDIEAEDVEVVDVPCGCEPPSKRAA